MAIGIRGGFGRLVGLALTAAVLGVLSPPAKAQPYLGWDFGGGFGIGIGPPPSAYNPCPNYGWPIYPYPPHCYYRYYPPRRAAVHHRRRTVQRQPTGY